MGSPPSEPQRSSDDERPTENAATEPDAPGTPTAGSPPDETSGSLLRPGADASERTARYLMGPTAFCA
jgi:hypothetical protein